MELTMRKILQLLFIIAIACALLAGVASNVWKYPIAIIALSTLGIIVSKTRTKNNAKTRSGRDNTSTAFVTSSTSGGSDGGSCGGDGGGC